MRVLVIDVQESRGKAARFAKRCGYTMPFLLDADGSVSARYAPAGVQPDLPRAQVPIASNIVIDREGKIRFYSLLDSAHFDARLITLQAVLDSLLASPGAPN